MLRPLPPAVAIAALALLALASPSRAADRLQVAAVRTHGTIKVDGVLDEADWQRAEPIHDLKLIFVREGQTPSESTDVRVLFDDSRIYFGIRCANAGPGAIRASVSPRDAITDDDFIAVHLDTYHDFHRAYVFGVNPFGVQLDGILTGGDVDLQWDGVWDAEAHRDASGWSAEIAIPLRILRFPDHGPGVWGLWIRRTITKNDEIASWPLWRQSVAGDIMLQAADLTGLEGLAGGGRVEARPYATSIRSAERQYSLLEDRSHWATAHDEQVGLDLAVAPTATLVLNATLNPDYSQVEADALQFDVNQRYPLFYPEKRPFFLEGIDYFSTPINLVYTRRIANPDYGMKATGTIGRVRIGGLVVRDAGGGSLEGIGDGPAPGLATKGMFEIGRVSWQIGEQSSIGGLVSAHQLDAGGPSIVPEGNRDAYPRGAANLVYAVDGRLRLAPKLYFTGQLARSGAHLDSSFTYYDSIPVSPRGGSHRFSGNAGTATLDWNDGIRELSLTHEYYGPGFRSESGFLQRPDIRHSALGFNFFVRPENAWLRSMQPILQADLYHDPDGPLQEWYVSPMIDWKFQKQTHFHTMVERLNERWQGRFYEQTRGIFYFDNSLWRALSISLNTTFGDGIFYAPTDAESYLGWTESDGATLTFRPSPRLTSEAVVSRNRFSRHGGAIVYDIWQSGLKTTFQFTRRFYVRLYPQYDSGTEHFEADGLLAYVVHPGTVFYAGLDSGVDPIGGRPEFTRHTAFFKASYAWVR